jgi:acyl carrier protein
MSTQQEVINIVVEQLGVSPEEVTLSKSFVEDLNADSLDLTELIMTIEERFGVEIPQEEAEKLRTVADLVHFVSRLRGTDSNIEAAPAPQSLTDTPAAGRIEKK